MVKEKRNFNIGDLVFAKVKGYPAWPAKLTKYNNKKFNVYFYGTGETANIKLEDLFPYAQSKEKFATERNMKRANFREAVEQIEAALNGEDIAAPIFMATTTSFVKQTPAKSINKTSNSSSSLTEKKKVTKVREDTHRLSLPLTKSEKVIETPKSDASANSEKRSQAGKLQNSTIKKKGPVSKLKKSNQNNVVEAVVKADENIKDDSISTSDKDKLDKIDDITIKDEKDASIKLDISIPSTLSTLAYNKDEDKKKILDDLKTESSLDEEEPVEESKAMLTSMEMEEKKVETVPSESEKVEQVVRHRKVNMKLKRRLMEALDDSPPPIKKRMLPVTGIKTNQ